MKLFLEEILFLFNNIFETNKFLTYFETDFYDIYSISP